MFGNKIVVKPTEWSFPSIIKSWQSIYKSGKAMSKCQLIELDEGKRMKSTHIWGASKCPIQWMKSLNVLKLSFFNTMEVQSWDNLSIPKSAKIFSKRIHLPVLCGILGTGYTKDLLPYWRVLRWVTHWPDVGQNPLYSQSTGVSHLQNKPVWPLFSTQARKKLSKKIAFS